jgi:hypothetical protein
LVARDGDDLLHATACHFPISVTEELLHATPAIADEERVIEPELGSAEGLSELSDTAEGGTR